MTKYKLKDTVRIREVLDDPPLLVDVTSGAWLTFKGPLAHLLCDALKQPKTVQSIAAEIDQGNEAVLQKIDDVIGKLTEYGFVDRIESD